MTTGKKHFWLMLPPEKVNQPMVWEMRRKLGVTFNIRNSSFNGAIKLIALELEGPENRIEQAVRWFKRRGVRVDPLELNIVEG